jgi:serine/threonine protein kinase
MPPRDEPGEDRTVIASDAVEPAPAPRRQPGTLVPGDVLNGIYRVDRFIARGGMGDVYEGVNVESDERVAIKAVRSHLAADPKVLALFRKEARVLTQFAHPALVQYRVLAREPTLELYYLVMDFIDGEPLSSMLDGTRPAAAAVAGLGLRLASGLAVAHEHGAIHRDMSPDNVLLPEGRVERAKIIDFGIAKSLDVAAETVVGDGFAGKIGYVAPEQFGDFDRQVGPWTDVYSLGLVLLSYARGRSSDMGSTLAEAVERPRA